MKRNIIIKFSNQIKSSNESLLKLRAHTIFVDTTVQLQQHMHKS